MWVSVECESVNVGSGVQFADQTAIRQTAEPALPSLLPKGGALLLPPQYPGDFLLVEIGRKSRDKHLLHPPECTGTF